MTCPAVAPLNCRRPHRRGYRPARGHFVGRGPGHVPAANGPGLNSGHYAVLGLVGSSGLVQPNDAMLHGILDAVDHLRGNGGAGREIKGHRDGYATSCPGDPLYGWIRRGCPRPSPAVKPEPKPETSWTEALVDNLPDLKPGDEHRHVKTMRGLLHSRGFEPKNLHSFTYEGEDLCAQVTAFKKAKKLGGGLVWDRACWEAALS
jgi:hypothetical protein